MFDAQPYQKVFVTLSFELGVVVGVNDIWEAVPADDVLLGEFFHLAGHNFPKCSCFYPLDEVVDGDQ